MPADGKSIPPHFSTTPLHHIIPIASACKRVISLALSKPGRLLRPPSPGNQPVVNLRARIVYTRELPREWSNQR